MKNSLWKHITVVEINGHIYEIQLVAIFCSHMSHHQPNKLRREREREDGSEAAC